MNSARDRPDFFPTASLATLRFRAALLTRLREFLTTHDFFEVETPILSADVVVDRHLDPMCAVLAEDPRQPDIGRRLWLQTSPEFGMKRLLAAGATAIFQVTRAFRSGEIGRLHNPEFTMVEWYRAGDDMAAGMALLSDLCETLLDRGPAERLSYAAAFERHVGLNPHLADIESLGAAAKKLKVNVPDGIGGDRDGWLNLLLAECVEPHLGQAAPTILFDYPASQAALAVIRSENPPVAERFELYVRGIELANGYHELLDAEELRWRSASNNAARVAEGKPSLPEESRLLAAMEAGLPACSGVALGFDRLVMIAAGATSIAEVIAFPIDRA
jgi:elongation factor P--(R)-beta-lysine ligase